MPLLVTACVAPPAIELPESARAPPPDFPYSYYENAKLQGESVYEIESADSLVRVFAYRAGALSRMGHDHVIASRAVAGYVLATPNSTAVGAQVQADLYMPFASLTVDDEVLRAEAGFETELSESAKTGTRSNMLADVGAAEFPHVIIHIEAAIDEGQLIAVEIPLLASITLHGTSATVEVPALVSLSTEYLRAEGRFTISQADFGIEPHSALGGALAVRDKLDIVFQINASQLNARSTAISTAR